MSELVIDSTTTQAIVTRVPKLFKSIGKAIASPKRFGGLKIEVFLDKSLSYFEEMNAGNSKALRLHPEWNYEVTLPRANHCKILFTPPQKGAMTISMMVYPESTSTRRISADLTAVIKALRVGIIVLT